MKARLPWILFLTLVFWIVFSLVFARFVHYHAQHRNLDPEHYKIERISEADYLALADPDRREVVLSGGSTIAKSPEFERLVLPYYRDMGDDYVKVTTLGTAHHLYYTSSALFPLLIFAIAGVVVTWPRRRP